MSLLVRTNATEGVGEIGQCRQHYLQTPTAEGANQVGWQPLHDYIVGPIHAEVSSIYRPQSPSIEKIAPPRRLIKLKRAEIKPVVGHFN